MSPRRQPAPSPEGSRQRIHDAAMRLFAQHGVDGVSMQRIADEAGLHKSSLFHHYRSKAELACEVVNHSMSHVVACMAPLAEDREPSIDAFIAVVSQLDDYFAEHRATARLIVSVMTAPEQSVLREPVQPAGDDPVTAFFTLLWTWLARARAAGAIRHVNIRQTIFNLIGVVLFYPATADETREIAGPEPFSHRARENRVRELDILIRGVLAR